MERLGPHRQEADRLCVRLYDGAEKLSASDAEDRLQAAYDEHRSGDLPRAIISYRAALAEMGDALAAYPGYLTLSRALSDNGQPAEAEAACRRALAINPNEPNGLAILAMLLADQGRLDEAAAAIDASMAAGRPHAQILNLATAIAIRRGDAQTATRLADQVLARDPYNPRALADLALAAVLAGDAALTGSLLDLDALVQVITPRPPPGYVSLEAFNQDLTAAIVGNPDLDHSGQAKTVIDAARLHDAFALHPVLTAGLRAIYAEAVEVYVAALSAPPFHPVVAGKPRRLNMTSWANVIQARGYEAPHIHESGWLSGVYYAAMPDLGPEEDASAGALLLGGHHYGDAVPERGPERVVRPQPGQVVLFPSYLNHRTLPFSGAGVRVSIAFDVNRED